MTIIVILPAYNEEKNIGPIIEQLKELKNKKIINDVLVIDDDSSDNTLKIIEQSGIKIVKHPINGGIGSSLRTGYKIAIMGNYDYVLQMDSDNQHDPKYIQTFIDTIERTNSDIVIGSRFLGKSYKNYSFIRRIGIIFFTKLIGTLSATKITDVTSGFRIYRVKSLEKLSQLPDKHWAIEQTLEAALKGLKIEEIPVEMPVRKEGKSQFDLKTYFNFPFRAIESILKVLLFK